MSNTFFRFADIEFGNSPTNEKIVGVFRFEQGRQNRQGPYHIVIAEIESALYAYEQLLDVINATVEQSRNLMAGMSLDPFTRFEKLIARVNEAIASFQEQEPTPINWKRINIYILECSQDQLCLSGIGRLSNSFFKKTEQGFQSFDLCGSLDQPDPIDPAKIFSALICGDMQPNDIFFIGTNNFNRLRNEINLKERLKDLPTATAAMEIKRALEQENPLDDFVGIIISRHQEEGRPSMIEKKEPAIESVKKLKEHEEQVQQSLAPTVNPLGKRSQDSATNAMPKIPNPVEPLRRVWEKITTFIQKKRTRPSASTETTLRSLHAGYGSFFVTKWKLITGAAVILIMIGIIGYSSWKHNKNLAQEQANWEQAYAQATDLKNRAENDLLYAKDEQAKQRVQQSEQILASLDAGDQNRQERIDQLTKDLKLLQDRLRKIVPVSGIMELHALPLTIADGKLTAPILTDQYAYAADNQNGKIVRVDLQSRQITELDLPDAAKAIIAGAKSKDSIYFVDQDGKFYEVEENAISPLNQFNAASSTTDFFIYNDRGYILDASSKQIYRLQLSRSGFTGNSTYLEGASDLLDGAAGLAIDSNVYVVKTNGSIVKFLSGTQEAFALGTVDPQIRALSSIWTESDDPRLLVTDPSDRRLLIFDKNGLLTAQLTSDEFGTMRDVTSEVNAKKALIISNNRLLLVPLP